MTTLMALIATGTSLITLLTISFSTVYRTSQSVALTTITSIASQLSTALLTATITQPEVIVASTMAVPITITQTMSQLFTSTPTFSLPPLPPATVEIVTSTVTSTLKNPGPTITFYQPPPLLKSATTTAELTVYPPTSTVTFTQVDLILENTAGYIYTTIKTILPLDPVQTGAAVFTIDIEEHGWHSWSNVAKGGLIAGMIVAGILLIGLIAWCLTRRRKIWLVSDWVGPPQQHILPTQPVSHTYWGPGHAGWGIRG